MGMRLCLTSTFHMPSGSLAFALPTSLTKRGLKISPQMPLKSSEKRIIQCLFFQNYRKKYRNRLCINPNMNTGIYYVAVQKW